jgi:hypothetical protein
MTFQSRVDGWLLDDLLADFDGARRAAVSVKSSLMFRGGRAPGEFVRDCWQLRLDPGKTNFSPDRDRLVLAASELPSGTRKAVDDAIARAGAAPDLLDTRIRRPRWTNDGVREFVKSFRCPSDLKRLHRGADMRNGMLLRAVRVANYDFGRVDSESEKNAVALCQQAVRSGTRRDASVLWRELQRVARKYRPASGSLDLEGLLDELRGTASLKAHPDYRHDWDVLAEASRSWADDTKDVIGTGLHIPREEFRQEVLRAANEARLLVVLGESGIGKSALLKDLSRAPELEGRPVFYLDAWEIAHPEQSGRAARLNHSLEEILPTQAGAWALLVVDRLDRLTDADEFKRVGRVLKSLRFAAPSSPWRVGVTCREPSWSGVGRHLSEAGVELQPARSIHLGGFTQEDIATIASKLPELASLLSRSELSPVVSKPKILDLIATAAAGTGSMPAAAGWVGESSIIEWFWTDYLCSGGRNLSRGNFLKRLAAMQADERRFASPTVALSSAEAEILPDLVNAGVLLQREETVRFAHDLYADYARQRYLLGQWSSGDRAAIADRVTNPIWYRAISLLGLHYLELSLSDPAERVEQWRRLARSCDQINDGSSVGSDLLFDAVVFSAQPKLLLDLLTTDLVADEGRLLKRLLVRMFQVASVSDPRVMDLPNFSVEERAELAVRVRLPIWPIWIRVVRWLTERRGLILEHAPEEFLPIAGTWLRIARQWPALPMSSEVADMVLAMAEKAATAFETGKYGEAFREPGALYILAALCGRIERERTMALALRLAGRGPEPPTPPKPPEPRSPRPGQWPPEWDELLAPWPDGPLRRPNHDFQEIGLSEPVASNLIDLDPKFAEEIFLALLIQPPKPRNPLFHDSTIREYGLEYIRNVAPPFYDFAPAARLLATAPDIGIDLVIRLSNFATERWAEDTTQDRGRDPAATNVDPPAITLVIDGKERAFLGDVRVFEWHTGAASVPDSLESALMALENWLYQKADGGTLEDSTLKKLLSESSSVAIIGVLYELALKRPELLAGPLECLVGSLELYFWTYEHVITSREQVAMIGWGFRIPQERVRLAFEWHSLPHRKFDFRKVVTRLWAARGLDWPALESARQRWTALRDSLDAEDASGRDPLEVVIEQYNPANWKRVSLPEGASGFVYEPPEQLLERSEKVRRRTEQAMQSLAFPIRCRRMLDGEADCSEEEILTMLEYAAESGRITDSEALLFGQSMAIRCGAAAVAILKGQEWLAQHSDWRARCTEWLLAGSAAINPPSSSVERRQIHGGASWDSFCADAISWLWAQSPEDQELRRAVAKLVGAHNDEAVGRLFSGLAVHRQQLGLDFRRLLHLAVWFARLNMIFWVLGENISGIVAAEFGAWTRKFVDGSLAPISEDWTPLMTAWPAAMQQLETGREQLARSPADTHFLQQVFSWLAGQAPNRPAADRPFLLKNVNNLSSILFERLRQPTRRRRTRRGAIELRDRHRLGIPDEFDHAVAGLNAAYLVNEPDARLRRAMSRKWFTLPEGAGLWLEDLVQNIYHHGMDYADAIAPSFLATIKDTFEFCLGKQGLGSRKRTVFHNSEVLQALIGWHRAYGMAPRWKTRWRRNAKPSHPN